jgi:hypothetical protein
MTTAFPGKREADDLLSPVGKNRPAIDLRLLDSVWIFLAPQRGRESHGGGRERRTSGGPGG